MASRVQPGDAVGVEATRAVLELVAQRCEAAGVQEYVLDPGIGMWTPSRSPDNDWDLCRHFDSVPMLLTARFLRQYHARRLSANCSNREPIDRLVRLTWRHDAAASERCKHCAEHMMSGRQRMRSGYYEHMVKGR